MLLDARLQELYRIELFNTLVRGKLAEGVSHEEAKKYAFDTLEDLETGVELDYIDEEGKRGKVRKAKAEKSVRARREKIANEIFNWLIRNSVYEPCYHSTDDINDMVKNYCEDHISLECAVQSVPAFHCNLTDFERFVGEKYSYKTHFKPLVDAGLISGVGLSDDPTFDRSAGLVKDYSTNKSYVRFWVGQFNNLDRVKTHKKVPQVTVNG